MEEQTKETKRITQNAKVIDTHTGATIGRYSTIKRARNKADKMDLEYGAYRYRAVLE